MSETMESVSSKSTRPPAPMGPVLVRRQGTEYGSIHQLDRSRRLGVGRANTNDIVIRDDGCSRNHAEVYWAGEAWMIQDLGSLNGTRVNEKKLEKPATLTTQDVIRIGQTEYVFFDDLSLLQKVVGDTAQQGAPVGFSIKRRQNQTMSQIVVADAAPRNRSSRDLQALYRLALQMGEVKDVADLASLVVKALLEATTADCGAILRIEEGLEHTLLAVQVPPDMPYTPPVDQIFVLASTEREALLIEETFESSGMKPRSGRRTAICAPVYADDELLAMLHLYPSNPLDVLGSEDLDLAVAVTQQLGPALARLERQLTLSSENEQLRETLRVETELIGESRQVREVISQIGMVAPTNATVQIRGESGVGKELVARALHLSSKRREGPFVCLNCAALPETLLESELFGHEKGAFTGASEQKKGKFEVAHKGTIFLDEIGEMTLSTQSKLLRVLDGQPFERVGGDKPIRANVRVVTATNRNLEKAVAEGQFRGDLYYRLQVVEIYVPPLRERKSDVSILARHFLNRFAGEMGRRMRGFSPEALAKLTAYDWPGNIRELRNVIERTVVLTRNSMIQAEDIFITSVPTTVSSPTVEVPALTTPPSLEQMEAEHIANALRFTNWNKSQTASLLGIERSTLDRKIKRYSILEPG